MSTVNKEIADRIVAGEYPEDQCTRIVRYENAFGGYGYGCTFRNQPKDTYMVETEYIRNPVIYWDCDDEYENTNEEADWYEELNRGYAKDRA